MTHGPARPLDDGAVELPDGRALGWAEFGCPGGDAVLWFHGTPGARLQVPPEAASEGTARGIRIITVERPGFGRSTPHAYDDLRGWARDVETFADRRGVERFAAVGLSGGGPYVLACAHELADRMVAGAVLGGLGPVRGPDAPPGYTRLLGLGRGVLDRTRAPLGAAFSRFLQSLRPVADQALWLYMNLGPPSDRPVFARPEMQEMFKTDILTGLAGGMSGPVYDVALFARDWGFSLRDVEVPIRFWQGDADLIVPFHHGPHQAALVRNGRLYVRPGEGHFAGFTALDQVLDELDAVWAERPGANLCG